MRIPLPFWSPRRLPIGWYLLSRFPVKFLTALLGIIFATVLIHVQLGLRAALFESSIAIFKSFNADLVMVSKAAVGSTSLLPYDRSRITIFERYPEVTETFPVRYDFAYWRYPDSRQSRLIIMLGFDPTRPIFTRPDIVSQQDKLILDSRILYDRLSRKEFGPVEDDVAAGKSVFAYINNHRVRVEGLIQSGTSFSYDASILTSLTTFENLLNGSPTKVEIGLIRLKTNVDANSFLEKIHSDIYPDVQVFTLEDFLKFEQRYWDQSKPIGFVFAFNALLGLAVGVLILYQILYTDVTAHLGDFSVLLALAHTRAHIRMIVFQESFILAAIGYPFGIATTLVLFEIIRAFTGLPVSMAVNRAWLCFVLILVMSTCSAILAIRKLDDANPIEVFS